MYIYIDIYLHIYVHIYKNQRTRLRRWTWLMASIPIRLSGSWPRRSRFVPSPLASRPAESELSAAEGNSCFPTRLTAGVPRSKETAPPPWTKVGA